MNEKILMGFSFLHDSVILISPTPVPIFLFKSINSLEAVIPHFYGDGAIPQDVYFAK